MAAPNVEELELVGQFRGRVKDLDLNEHLGSDMELLRWIRARDKDLNQAELMLRKHTTWRKEVEYDEISTWEMPKQCESVQPEFVGFDDDNFPLVVTPCGKWKLKELIQEVGAEAVMKSKWKVFASIQEMMKSKVTPEGVPPTQLSNIVDLDGLPMSQSSLSVLRLLTEDTRIYEANFPEFTRITVVINAPWYFPLFYKCIKPFLSPKTTEKIHVFGKNRQEWTEFLKSTFPDRLLPKIYGGSNDISIS